MKAKGEVKLRMKPLKNGGQSLYLDIYRNGFRRYEFLHLYLVPETTSDEKLRNEETLRVAKAICAKRTISLQLQGNAMQMASDRQISKVVEDYVALTSSKSRGTHQMWKCWEKKVKTWQGCSYPVRDADRDWWNKYTLWVQNLPLKPTTKHHYLSRMRTVLHFAERQGWLLNNPAKAVRLPHLERSNRVYLTAEELRKLMDAECSDKEVSRAFLFACLCGLRFSDIQALRWENVKGSRLTVRVQKTQRSLAVELNAQAVELLGERGEGKVFRLPSKAQVYVIIQKWAEAAQLGKHISFHTSRHTFAVLALSSGVDIYTLSKILGHSSVTTTQIYADILDSRKREAVEKLPRI